MRYPSAIDKKINISVVLWSFWLWMGGVRQLSQARGCGLSLTVQWAEFWSERERRGVSRRKLSCVFAHLGQVLLAEPEERRSFMDIRLLLARGDIGEAKSLPSTCIAGLSASWLSRHEPVGEGREEEEEKKKTDQNVTTARSFAHCSQTSTQMWHLITKFDLGLWIRIWNGNWVYNVYTKQNWLFFCNVKSVSLWISLRLEREKPLWYFGWSHFGKFVYDMSCYNKCNQLRAKEVWKIPSWGAWEVNAPVHCGWISQSESQGMLGLINAEIWHLVPRMRPTGVQLWYRNTNYIVKKRNGEEKTQRGYFAVFRSSIPFTASVKDLPFQAFSLYLDEPNVF